MIAGLYAEINTICILILVIFLYKLQTTAYMKKNQYLLTLNIICFIIFFGADLVWALIDGGQILASVQANSIVNIVYFSVSGIAGYFWFLYCANMENSILVKNKTLLGLMSLPCILLLVLTINSPSNKWIFYIDSANEYHRGNLYFVQIVVVYGYIAFTALMSLYNAFKRENVLYKSLFISFGYFPIFPLIAFGLQVILPGYPLTAIGLTIPLVLAFLKMLELQDLADELTLLYNRNWLYINHNILHNFYNEEFAPKNTKTYLILLDIDRLSYINSEHGVETGNSVLRYIAYLLLGLIKKRDIGLNYSQPVRFGEDEFVIVVELDENGQIQDVTEAIQNDIDNANKYGMFKCDVSVSMASIPYNTNEIYLQDTIDELDLELYKVKKAKLYT